MEIWAWTYSWNCPRRMDVSEDKIAAYAEEEDSADVFLFYAELLPAVID